MPTALATRRLLVVQAHPDDETIACGATMARYAAEGVEVTLVTCTLGEEGDVLLPALSGLAAAESDQLGGYRLAELHTASERLGVSDVVLLGGVGHYRDSGFRGTANGRDTGRRFATADLTKAAHHLAAILTCRRPHVVVTHDSSGGYGHADHVRASQVTGAAVELAAPSWTVPKLYWTATARSAAAERFAGRPTLTVLTPPKSVDDLHGFVADDVVTAAVDGRGHLAAKKSALRAYGTQVVVEGEFFGLADLVAQPILGVEHFRQVVGRRMSTPDGRWETDLFAGVRDT